MRLKRLRGRIASVVDGVEGRMGVAVRDIESGEEVGIGADDLYPMASVCKTPILVEAYRQAEAGLIDLGMRVELTPETRVAGSGLLNFCDEGLKPTLRDLLLLMIVVSDNAATDLVLRAIGGPSRVTGTMASLGLGSIRMHRTIFELIHDIRVAIDPIALGMDYHAFQSLMETDERAAAIFRDRARGLRAVTIATKGRDVASPRDIARLYALIGRAECAGAESCEAIITTLERQQLKGRLPRDLPSNTRCCHKTGTLGDGSVSNDTGIIYIGDRAVAVAVLSKRVRQEPARTNAAIARIGRIVYDHFAA